MTDEETKALIERLRNLARNVSEDDPGEVTVGKFIIGEDLSSGNLSVDVIAPLMKRNSRGVLKDAGAERRCFMMVDRDGSLSIKNRYRDLLEELSRTIILDELANI